MKREEALRIIKECKEKGFKHTFYTLNEYHTALDIAIKALEQEPCDDAINREDALMCLTGEIKDTDTIETIIARFIKRLKSLPPVNPQPKMGEWIDDKCSICGKGIEDLIDSREWYRNEEPNFCPFCGAKMVEPQESEG